MKKKSKLMAAVFALILGVSTVMPGMQAQAANMDNFPVQNMSTHQKKLYSRITDISFKLS